jgi:hypothetical protein
MTAPEHQPSVSTPDATAAVAQSRPGESRRPPATGRPARLGCGQRGKDYVIGPRVTYPADVQVHERRAGEPLYRPLHIYTLDPNASRRDGRIAVVNVPYEPLEAPGPIGKLLAIQEDGPSQQEGLPLDLNRKDLLLSSGCAPSPADPLFRRQMVYAVCSTTFAAFRQALGRIPTWGFGKRPGESGPLRLAIRVDVPNQVNAFYSRSCRSLSFGVFPAPKKVVGPHVPGAPIYTSLSHDVVVHEMSHSLLDGLRTHFMVPSNQDVLAFHEAFADIVAILQRFTYRDVVSAGIRRARGRVREEGEKRGQGRQLLTEFALQIGQTNGLTGALRSAVAGTKYRYGGVGEAHERGEVLLAAVFEAFSRVYDQKAKRLIRLATQGTGILPAGEIPDGLAELLTDAACKLASQFLSVVIRAIDYCPPVDITFGEYLRAVITADYDLVPDDVWSYREAWIESFLRYEIRPTGVDSITEESLRWRATDIAIPAEPELSFRNLRFAGDPGEPADANALLEQADAVGALVSDPEYCGAFGLVVPGDKSLDKDTVDLPVVQSVRSSRRVGPDGQIVFDLVAEVTQRRVVQPRGDGKADEDKGFDFYGGSTIILDPTGRVRYVIRKSVGGRPDAEKRLTAQRAFVVSEVGKREADYRLWGPGPENRLLPEPDALRLMHDKRDVADGGARPTTPSGNE